MPMPLGYKQKYKQRFFDRGLPGISEGRVTITDKRYPGKNKPDSNVAFFYKKETASHIPELEAGIAEIYSWLLTPERSAKIRKIKDDPATVSKRIFNGDDSFYKKIVNGRNLFYRNEKAARDTPLPSETISQLASKGLGSLLAASYLMMETDLHWNNLGFNSDGNLSRIDYGLSLPIFTYPAFYEKFKQHCEIVSQDDIKHLLNPSSFKALNTLLKVRSNIGKSDRLYSLVNTEFGKSLLHVEEDTRFIVDKWKIFIKASFLTKEDLKKMLSAHITDINQIDNMVEYIYARFQNIAKSVFSLTEVQRLLENQGAQILQDIERECDIYNLQFKKTKEEFECRKIKPDFGKIKQFIDLSDEIEKADKTIQALTHRRFFDIFPEIMELEKQLRDQARLSKEYKQLCSENVQLVAKRCDLEEKKKELLKKRDDLLQALIQSASPPAQPGAAIPHPGYTP